MLIQSQISTNGFISFQDRWDFYIVERFPREIAPFLPLIAPLWADFNFRDSGTIFYRVATDAATLNQVTDALCARNTLYADFRPTLAVVVTWFQGELLRSSTVVRTNIIVQLTSPGTSSQSQVENEH